MVPNTGLEPVTSSMSWKHSTTELIGHLLLTGANNTLGLLKGISKITFVNLKISFYRFYLFIFSAELWFEVKKKYPDYGKIYHHVGKVKDSEVKTTMPVDVVYDTTMVETVIDIGEPRTD